LDVDICRPLDAQFLGQVGQMRMLGLLESEMVGRINYSKVFVFRGS
jgi:hypothetical protein